jgi:hypothetical protein
MIVAQEAMAKFTIEKVRPPSTAYLLLSELTCYDRTSHSTSSEPFVHTKSVAYESVLTSSSSTSERDLPGTALLVATSAALSLTVRQTQFTQRSPDSLALGSESLTNTCHRDQALHLLLPWPLRNFTIQNAIGMGEMAHRWGPLEELAVAQENNAVGEKERQKVSAMATTMGHHHGCYALHPTLLCSPRCTIRAAMELAAVLGS